MPPKPPLQGLVKGLKLTLRTAMETMFPDGPLMGSSAPIAAAIGSSMRYAFPAPAWRAASRT